MKTNIIAGLLAAVLTLAGCKEGPAGPDNTDLVGAFDATISGGFSASLTGSALSFTQQGAYLIRMDDTEVNGLPGAIGLFYLGGRPPVGSYPVSAGQATSGGFVAIAITGQNANQNGLAFEAESGTVTITESNASRVQGSFDLTGTGYRGNSPADKFEVEITGQFDAVDQDS